MNAFQKAFGPKEQVFVVEQPQSMQEKAISRLMGSLIPGFDLAQIKSVTEQVGQTIEYMVTTMRRIEEQQQRILEMLGETYGDRDD